MKIKPILDEECNLCQEKHHYLAHVQINNEYIRICLSCAKAILEIHFPASITLKGYDNVFNTTRRAN